MSKPLPARSDVPVEHTWDLDAVFPSLTAWEEAFKAVEAQIPRLTAFQGNLSEGPGTLADWFATFQEVFNLAGKVMIYGRLGYTVDTTDPVAAARSDRSGGLMARISSAAAFAEPELLAIGMETLNRWVDADPALAPYAHYIDRLAQRTPHVRSAEVEALLGQLSEPFRTASATHGILADADLLFEPAHGADDAATLDVAQSTMPALIGDPDRTVRRTAYENYAAAYLTHKNSMANCIATGVKQNVFLARARRYGSALEAALAPSFLPVEVFHNTIDTFKANLETWHRYWRVRRLALGYDELHPYDFRAPLTRQMPEVPFEQAMAWISSGMRPLGEQYVADMRRGVLQERWVDIYPNKGKRLGAFSAGIKGTHPYIFMSYSNSLFGMSTLAHELGHSLHSYYSRRAQPFLYSRYSLFEAEVASNFNQALTRAHLLATTDDPEFQIAVIEEAMSNFYRYFFVMPTLARFELAIHEQVEQGQALTADGLINLMADLFAEGFGDAVVMDRERVGITWAQFPTHLYSNFYVFQYTTGISGAHALAQPILAGDQDAVDNYLAFLHAGGSRYPLDNLRQAGVDMASPAPVVQTFDVLAQYVTRLEDLIAQR